MPPIKDIWVFGNISNKANHAKKHIVFGKCFSLHQLSTFKNDNSTNARLMDVNTLLMDPFRWTKPIKKQFIEKYDHHNYEDESITFHLTASQLIPF